METQGRKRFSFKNLAIWSKKWKQLSMNYDELQWSSLHLMTLTKDSTQVFKE
jgi:hypothetical protein